MKTLLLASTALVATAGFAAADVALTGSAEMGVVGGENMETQFHTDIDVTFTLSGESDNGISFGASIDLDEEGGFASTNGGPEAVFISAGAATLTMGDTDGAFDAALTEVAVGSSIADDHTVHAGYSGNGGATFDNDADQIGTGLDGAEDGQVARFDYTFSGATFSLSAELDDDGESALDTNDNPVWGLGVAYSAELAGLDLGVGLGYQTKEDFGTAVGLSLSTTFNNGLQAIVNYSRTNLEDDVTIEGETGDVMAHAAIGLGYTMDALTLGLNYGAYNLDGEQIQSGVGLAANYDMGGGLSAQMGYGASEFENSDSTNTWSLGLAMSF